MSLLHQIALSLIPSVGPVNARKLLQHFGDPIKIFESGRQRLQAETGMSSAMAAEICSPSSLLLAEKQIRFLEKQGCKVLFFDQPDYPTRLRYCHDAPILLYSRGCSPLNHTRIISIVGSRKASPYGLSSCATMLEELQDYNIMVISGLAYGIDIQAHRCCLQLGIPTAAVVGHGLEMIYPAAHRKTAEAMLEIGGLISEFPFQTACRPENFPKRNRIIAGLADLTLVVEAAVKGGALITADLANSYDREVYALPGRLNDHYSAGCNHLIQTNQAILFQETAEMMAQMGWSKSSDMFETSKLRKQQERVKQLSGLNMLQQQIYQQLSKAGERADTLLRLIPVNSGQLSLELLELEMKGLIQLKSGSIYEIRK